MQKWEYLVLERRYDGREDKLYWVDDKGSRESKAQRLDKAGLMGWELVSVTGNARSAEFYLKRSLYPT